MGLNLHLYPSALTHDSRIMKATKSLLSLGIFSEIHVVGIHDGNLVEHEDWDDKRKVWRVRIGRPLPIPKLRSISLHLNWAIKIIRRYNGEDVMVVQCHNLDVLPLGVLMRIGKRNCRLVYDAHELETERNGLRGINKKVAKLKERFFIRFADEVVAVSESIVSWYKEHYKIENVSLVRNVPHNDSRRPSGGVRLDRSIFRRKFGIGDDSLIFLYQGALMRGRGIELLLEVFSRLGKGRHIIFMGYGSYYEHMIQEYAVKYPNIHYHQAVSPQEVHQHTVGADIGLCIIEDACLSYYFCLPNKLYEYTLAGIPVIASDFPEMARAVKELGNGWTVAVDEESIFKLIRQLTPESIEEKRRNSVKAQNRIGWHNEEATLLEVYRRLILESS